MEIGGNIYVLTVTSANDFDSLSLECTHDNALILEAELSSYENKMAKIHFHKNGLSLDLVEAFINEVKKELKYGGKHSS